MRLGWGRGGQDSQKSSEKSLDEFLSERLGKRSQGHYLAHPISSIFSKVRNHRKCRVFWICGKMRENAGICGNLRVPRGVCAAHGRFCRKMRENEGKCGKLQHNKSISNRICGKMRENAGNCAASTFTFKFLRFPSKVFQSRGRVLKDPGQQSLLA